MIDSNPGQFTEFFNAAKALSGPNEARLESTCVLTDTQLVDALVPLPK